MIELTEAKIKELIAQKKAELDKFVIDVNADIARRNGEIAALTSLIEPDLPEETPAAKLNGEVSAETKPGPSKRKRGQAEKA